MTPEELARMLTELDVPLSAIAFGTGIERSRLQRYLDGAVNALTAEEAGELRSKVVVDENKQVAHFDEQRHIVDGIGDYLRRRSIAFMYEQSGKCRVASGTLVRIGTRLLVATAAHTVPRGSQMLEFVGGNVIYVEASAEVAPGQRVWKGFQSMNVLGGNRHPSLDVGVIELEPSAANLLKRDPISLSHISVRTPQYGRTAFVFGFPAEFEHRQPISGNEVLLHLGSLTYPSPVLAPDEWPTVPADSNSPDESTDCFLSYNRDDSWQSLVPIGEMPPELRSALPKTLPAVHGMSGGGFWQNWSPIGAQTVWAPDDYLLFAVQSTWNERGKYIRGILVRHWLELIADSYQDLKPLIDEHFGCTR